MGRLDMHTLQEFVRLARMGTGFRAVARMLRLSPNTEREYHKVFEAEGLLVGDPNDLPEVAVLHAVLEKHRPARLAPQQESSVERWAAEVIDQWGGGVVDQLEVVCVGRGAGGRADGLPLDRRSSPRLSRARPAASTDDAGPFDARGEPRRLAALVLFFAPVARGPLPRQ